jgi:hypothetical protein
MPLPVELLRFFENAVPKAATAPASSAPVVITTPRPDAEVRVNGAGA